MKKTIVGIMLLIMSVFVGCGEEPPQVQRISSVDGPIFSETEYNWVAPTTGTPVDHYVGQQKINGGVWSEPRALTGETNAVFYLVYDVANQVRVAGVDLAQIQGPYSTASDPYTPRRDPGEEPEELTAIMSYAFNENSGNTVFDISPYGDPINLTIKHPENVVWSRTGLSIITPTILYNEEFPYKLHTRCSLSNEITISIIFSTRSLTQDGPARLVTYSVDPYARNFTFGQDLDKIDVRLNTTSNDENGMPSAFASGLTKGTVWFVYTRNEEGTAKIYINRNLVSTHTVSGTFASWSETCLFAVANEITEDRPWLGTIYKLDIFDVAVLEEELPVIYGKIANKPDPDERDLDDPQINR